MADQLEVSIAPVDGGRSSFIAYYSGTLYDLVETLEKGGFAKFSRGSGEEYWLNLDNVHSVTPAPADT